METVYAKQDRYFFERIAMKKKYISLLLSALLLLSACNAPSQQDRDVVEFFGEDDFPRPSDTHAMPDASPTPEVTPPPVYATPMPTLTPAAPVTNVPLYEKTFTVDCESYLNLRKSADAQAEIVGRLDDGTKVQVLGFDGKFAHVRRVDNQQRGYVLAGYLKSGEHAFGVVKPFLSYTHAQMTKDLQTLDAQYSSLSVESAGKSAQGRELWVAVIGSKEAAHHVFIQAGIHGREHMTSLLAMMQIEWALKDGQIPADVCVHIMPMSNPDGIAISQTGKGDEALNAIAQSDQAQGYVENGIDEKYWYQWKANYNGVDLNRNFDAGWEKIDTRPQASSANYRGTAPESEPETQALVNYTKKYAFDATLSYHATGSLIYWEFGPNSPVNEASKSLAEAVSAVTEYPIFGDDGTSFGGYKDWAISVMGIPSLTVEIGTRSCPLPLLEFDTIWERNREVLPAVAKWVQGRE